MADLGARLKHAWNAFKQVDHPPKFENIGSGRMSHPDITRYVTNVTGSLLASLYSRIAIDVATVDIIHARVDKNENFLEEIPSGLNECLKTEANIDQTGRQFIRELVLSMFNEGRVAVVPVDTTIDPSKSASWDIKSLRIGRILEWFPQYVQVDVYNDQDGLTHALTLPKKQVAIIENPLDLVTQRNSTVARIAEKLAMLDKMDAVTSSGKMDLIIQLPYVIKSEARKQQAELRRKAIEEQLTNSTYGIAYTDGTERITQLNRPVENSLLNQIKYLTEQLYNQLGLTEEIFKGTADEKAMLNYYNRTVEPILAAIANEFKRKFLTKTARTQGQTVMFVRNPFKMAPITSVAEMADRFTRNEILTSNEIRGIIGFQPSDEPQADELRNKNLNADQSGFAGAQVNLDPNASYEDFDQIDSDLDAAEEALGHDALQHYASKYYDPIKAHEYYMRTRKLKGHHDTKLNEHGKEAEAFIKKSISDERKRKVGDHASKGKAQIDTVRKRNKAKNMAATESIQAKARSLREMISRLPKEQRAAQRQAMLAQIEQLRAQNRQNRERLTEDLHSKMQSTRKEHKDYRERAKDEADTKAAAEIDRLYNDSSMIQPKKAKKPKAPKKPRGVQGKQTGSKKKAKKVYAIRF